jgi:hypothetical protein
MRTLAANPQTLPSGWYRLAVHRHCKSSNDHPRCKATDAVWTRNIANPQTLPSSRWCL